MPTLQQTARRADDAVQDWLRQHALTALRLALGAVFLGFGVLKFVPGLSPAQDLAATTTRLLTFGLVPDTVARIGVAALECTIGLCLLGGGRLLRVAVALLVPEMVGILSPVALLPGRLFAGPHHAPTLEAQYVLKDVVLVAAVMALATTLRGAALRLPAHLGTPAAASAAGTGAGAVRTGLSTHGKLAVVLSGVRGELPVDELCATHGITAGEYYRWRNEILAVVGEFESIGRAATLPG